MADTTDRKLQRIIQLLEQQNEILSKIAHTSAKSSDNISWMGDDVIQKLARLLMR